MEVALCSVLQNPLNYSNNTQPPGECMFYTSYVLRIRKKKSRGLYKEKSLPFNSTMQ